MIAKRKADRDARAGELERLMAPPKKKKGKKGKKIEHDIADEEEQEGDDAPESPYKAQLREMAQEEAAYKKSRRAEAQTAKKGYQSAITASSVTEMKHLKNPP